MTTLSTFYGIIVSMQHDKDSEPYIRAWYRGEEGIHEGTFDLDGDELDVNLDVREVRLIQAWIELCKDELAANWELARRGDAMVKIPPLSF